MHNAEQPVEIPAAVKPGFVAELPPSVTTALQAEGVKLDVLTLAVQSDLGPDGRFGEQWLLMDSHDLWVIERHNGTANLRHKFPLDKIEDAKVERCVGNGLMQVTVDQQPTCVALSNELTDRSDRRTLSEHTPEFGEDTPVPIGSGTATLPGVWALPGRHSSKVCPNCIQRGKLFRRLMDLARPSWGKMGVIVILLVAGVLVDLLPPYLTRILIDDVLRVDGGTGGDPTLLPWLVGSLLGIQLIRVLLTIVTNWSTINVSTRFTSHIRDRLFAHLKKLSVDYFDKNQVGRLMTRINQDTEELQGLVSQMTTFTLNILLVIGIGVCCSRWHHRSAYTCSPDAVCGGSGLFLLPLYAAALPALLGGSLALERDAQHLSLRRARGEGVCAGRRRGAALSQPQYDVAQLAPASRPGVEQVLPVDFVCV